VLQYLWGLIGDSASVIIVLVLILIEGGRQEATHLSIVVGKRIGLSYEGANGDAEMGDGVAMA